MWMDPYSSVTKVLNLGVPRGSSPSPTLFNIYMAPLAPLVKSFGIKIVSNADDMQLLLAFKNGVSVPQESFKACLGLVINWMCTNNLQCNSNKMKILPFRSAPTRWWESCWPDSLATPPPPATVPMNLGVKFNQGLSFKPQISAVVGSCLDRKASFRERV